MLGWLCDRSRAYGRAVLGWFCNERTDKRCCRGAGCAMSVQSRVYVAIAAHSCGELQTRQPWTARTPTVGLHACC